MMMSYFLLLAVGALPAADPQPIDDLLRLVPDNPAFCFVVRDLRGHSQRLADSPFAAQFKNSPISATLGANNDLKPLTEADKQLKELFGTSLAELRDEIFGDGFVFAYWPAAGGGTERGVFLARARQAELLAKLVGRLREIGTQSGDLKALADRQHEGWTYHRFEDKDGKTTFALVRDRLAAISEDEGTLRQVIDRAQTAPPASPIARQLAELGLSDALAALLVNPRAFDAEIEKKAKSAADGEAAFLRTLTKYWKHTEAIAFSLRLEQEATLGVSLKLNPAGFPEAARRLLEQPAQSSDLWRHFPERTLFAAGGRLDAASLFEILSEFVPEEKRKKDLAELEKATMSALGLDLKKEVLPNVGPNWGVFVAAPPQQSTDWFPQVVLAVRLQHKPDHRPLDEAVFEPLRTLVGLVAISQSKPGKPITVKTQEREGVPMVTLHGPEVFPPGCQPTLALKAGCLVVASSPEAVALFREQPGPARSAAEESVLARLSLAEIARYLKHAERRKALVQAISQSKGLPATEVDDGITKVTEALALFDRLELAQQRTADQVHLTLQLKTSKPLRK